MRCLAILLIACSLVRCCNSFRPVSVSHRPTRFAKIDIALPASNSPEETTRNPIYQLLSTPRDDEPGRCNFFYNDEVMSHLHGYMLLVGLFAARDETFLLAFGAFASIAAGATLSGNLPANPRVPAVVAISTLAITWLCRYGVGYEPMFVRYEGPTDAALYFEIGICALNMAWGFGGSWRTKEPINGATFGF